MSALAINFKEERQNAPQVILDVAGQCVLPVVHMLKQLDVQPALGGIQKLGQDATQAPHHAHCKITPNLLMHTTH